MKIRIGKASDNDYTANDPYVSRYHALLFRDAEGCLLLEDLDSANGTYVNGVQIMRKRITPSDKVKLGHGFILNISEALKSVYDRYIEQKVRIQSSNQFKTRLFQSLPFALPGVIGILIGFMGKGSSALFGISLFVAICAPVTGIYMGARQSAKIPKQLQDLANQFKIDYVCPKCGTFLGEIPWESLANKKQCPVHSCKAKWVADE
ncbi:MAG: FHA domain-containing protein [Tannerellaceae bacterium]|jgi:pSer/pThr/pTyr-binding forkhead associated (FHA) protein|nr:FHA domain-containing protein [Tannerellaceae bacterium]